MKQLTTFALTALLAACASSPTAPVFDAVAFEQCRDEVLRLDAAARREALPPRFAVAGRLASRCVTEASPSFGQHRDDVAKLHLFAVLALIQGGEVSQARDLFLEFEPASRAGISAPTTSPRWSTRSGGCSAWGGVRQSPAGTRRRARNASATGNNNRQHITKEE